MAKNSLISSRPYGVWDRMGTTTSLGGSLLTASSSWIWGVSISSERTGVSASPLVVGPAQTGFSACQPPPPGVGAAGADRSAHRLLLPDLAAHLPTPCTPCLICLWVNGVQGLRVEGPVLLHQDSPSTASIVVSSEPTLDQNIPLYTCASWHQLNHAIRTHKLWL